MKITIITPCSRPENLKKIKESINIKCRWIIVYDSYDEINQFNEDWIYETNLQGGISGNKQRNYGLDCTESDSWVYFLDDDNLLHPDFIGLIAKIKNQEAKGYIFAQDIGNGYIRYPDKIEVGGIDQAQYLLHYDLIKNKRFIQKYDADGHFIEEIYAKKSAQINVLGGIFCYYNRIRI